MLLIIFFSTFTASVTAGAEQRTDWKLIDSYDGATPFLIGGDITLDDMALLEGFAPSSFLGSESK